MGSRFHNIRYLINKVKVLNHLFSHFVILFSFIIISHPFIARAVNPFKGDSTYAGTKRFFDPSAHSSESDNEESGDIEIYDPSPNAQSASVDKQKLISQMFGNETKDLNWPPLPRSWMERSIVQQKILNQTLGLQFSPFNIGLRIKKTKNNTYSVKTSLVIASSSVPVHKGKKSPSNLSKDFNYRSLLIADEKNHQLYPNVNENFPMIGFCSFEAKYVIESSESIQASFQGSEMGNDESISHPVVYLFTSKLFQIKKDVSIRQYLNSVCGDIFRSQIENKVLSDFQKLKTEVEFSEQLIDLNKRYGDCELNSESGKMTFSDSDDSCIEWQRYNFNEVIQARTVARCEFNKALKKNKCVLHSRENRTCPIYWDTLKKQYTTAYTLHKTVPATDGYYEFSCDDVNGLACVFKDEPKLLLNVPFWSGKGICVKKSDMSQSGTQYLN